MSGRTANSSRRRWAGSSVYFAGAAITLSLFALAIVLGNVAAGAPRQQDENAWAHLFQLALAAQLPLLAVFLATADWSRRAVILLVAQLCSAAAALGALWWSGY